MASVVGAVLGPPSEANDHAPVLRWVLLNCVLLIAVYVLWQFGFLQRMLDTDPTRVSLLVILVFVLTALHCLFQTIFISRELTAARRTAALLSDGSLIGATVDGRAVLLADGTPLPAGVLTTHIARLMTKARRGNGERIDQTLLLRSVADQLRSREKLGWFVSEALLRLALLGTAIGFILMLIPITEVNSFDTETLRVALSGMTGGMAIALNVTVAGIAAALALKVEYYLLDNAVAQLFTIITEVTEVDVIPALERPDARA